MTLKIEMQTDNDAYADSYISMESEAIFTQLGPATATTTAYNLIRIIMPSMPLIHWSFQVRASHLTLPLENSC
jgi:hypothetical protein